MAFLSQTFASNIFLPDTYLASHDRDGRKKEKKKNLHVFVQKVNIYFVRLRTQCEFVHKF